MFLYYINSTTLISLILKLHFLRTTGQSQLLNSSIKWIFIISHRDHVNVSHMMNKGSPPGYGGEPVCQYPFKQKSACAFCKTCNFKSFTLIPFTWASSYFPLFFLFVPISHPHLLGLIIFIAPRVCWVWPSSFQRTHRTCLFMQLNKIKNKTIILLFIGL